MFANGNYPQNIGMSEFYFGVKKTQKMYLDDTKEQWIEYKMLTEGERIKYQDEVSGKVSFDQLTQKAEIESKVGSDRQKLIQIAVCGFNIFMPDPENVEGKKVENAFSREKWEELYSQMNAASAEKLYQEIIEFNGFGAKKK